MLADIKEQVVGKISFPFLNYLLNAEGIMGVFKGLLQSQWFSEDLLRELQFKKLVKIIRYARQYVPYYQRKFKEIGLDPQDIKNLEDIKLIPALNRQDVIDFHKEMVDVRFQAALPFAEKSRGSSFSPVVFGKFRKNKLIRNASSGSTGSPVAFYDDGTRSSISWANELRLKNWHRIGPGAKEARLVRLSTEYHPKSRIDLMRKMIWNQLILPGMNLSDDEYEICTQKILKFKPTLIWGITSALTGWAEYIKKRDGLPDSYRPKLIICWAAPVYSYERKILEDMFHCPVTNIYGTREVGHIAGMCPAGSLHINQENLLVESVVLDGNSENNPIPELLVTSLDRNPMPFIRYRIGDAGEFASNQCNCGRSLQVLKNLVGRLGEIIISKEGRMISPNFWGSVLKTGGIPGAVKRFQIIYTKSKDLKMRIEKGKNYSDETESYIRDVVGRNFSPLTKLTFEYVQKIEPQVSGKYQMVVNETINANIDQPI